MVEERHFLEVKMVRGLTYRYFGWAHVPGAKCIGEGDWRIWENGEERKTNGALVPADVLHAVAEYFKRGDHGQQN